MNHGYCENCWWWEPIKFDLKEAKWVLGICWMWRNNQQNKSYCPDYWNRKKGDKEHGTLEEWASKAPMTFEFPKDTKFKRK